MSRAWPIPTAGTTIHCIGDLHIASLNTTRRNKFLDDINNGAALGAVRRHVAVGDLTQNGVAAEDTQALAFLDALPYEWLPVMGGHDVLSDVRTPAEWAAVYGVPDKNYVVDLDFARLVFIAPDDDSPLLTAATLSWLDARLAESTDDCLIFCHVPMYDTVGSGEDGAKKFLSTQTGYYTTPDADIRQVLADNPKAKAFISGHTHSSLDTVGFVTPLTLGGHTVATVNCSSPYYQDRTGANTQHNPLQSVYVTYLGDRIEVRFRDHGKHCWLGPSAVGRVWTVDL